MIRADLCRRIDSLGARCGQMDRARLAGEVDRIRRAARTHGLLALESLAGRLQTGLALEGGGAGLLSYLDLMRDAAACEQEGPDVSAAYMAALSLRLGA